VVVEIVFGVVKETGQRTSKSYEWQVIWLDEHHHIYTFIIIIRKKLLFRVF
jgi:hypothetical protein